jgi:transcriptional regulator with XRE-family HTH domain
MISGAQIRAARGLLGWTSRELARRTIVSDATVYALEHVLGLAANVDALAAVQATLEAEGVEFTNGDAPGVRLRPKGQRGR